VFNVINKTAMKLTFEITIFAVDTNFIFYSYPCRRRWQTFSKSQLKSQLADILRWQLSLCFIMLPVPSAGVFWSVAFVLLSWNILTRELMFAKVSK